MSQPSDITSPPADDEVDGRVMVAIEVLRDVADELEDENSLAISSHTGGMLMGVVIAIMQENGWSREQGELVFREIWGIESPLPSLESDHARN